MMSDIYWKLWTW